MALCPFGMHFMTIKLQAANRPHKMHEIAEMLISLHIIFHLSLHEIMHLGCIQKEISFMYDAVINSWL